MEQFAVLLFLNEKLWVYEEFLLDGRKKLMNKLQSNGNMWETSEATEFYLLLSEFWLLLKRGILHSAELAVGKFEEF
jgi:hypothetical protein